MAVISPTFEAPRPPSVRVVPVVPPELEAQARVDPNEVLTEGLAELERLQKQYKEATEARYKQMIRLAFYALAVVLLVRFVT